MSIGPRVKLISELHFAAFESHLATVMDRYFNNSSLQGFNQIIRSAVLENGGKRIRPQLALWVYEHASGSEEIPDALMDLACGWELFHAFLLAHDDIIDNSDTRRGRPSLHRRLAELDGSARQFGMNLGIVAGDLLFSTAMQLWHGLELEPQVHLRQIRLFSRIASTTGCGQAVDILQSHRELDSTDEQLLLREYHWKTAAYTFEGPMMSGAIAAGLTEAAEDAISRYALSLGQAYQIQNDLQDLQAPLHAGSDLLQGKRTLTLLYAREELRGAERRMFDQAVNGLSQCSECEAMARAELLLRQIHRSNAIEQTRHAIDSLLSTARAAADDPALPAGLAGAMAALLDSLRAHYFVAGATDGMRCSSTLALQSTPGIPAPG